MRHLPRGSTTLTLAVALCAASAHAETADETSAGSADTTLSRSAENGEPLRVHVGKLQGAKPTSARTWLVEGLRDSGQFDLVSPDEPQLETGASESDIASFAKDVQADVVMLGQCRFGKKGWTATLTVHDGKDGSVVGSHDIDGGSWSDYESELKAGAFVGLFSQAEGFPPPPPLEEPSPEPPPQPISESVAEESATPVSAAPRPDPLKVEAGIRLYSRAFRYKDSLAQLEVAGAEPLESYNLDAGPMPLLHVQWYPGAHFASGVLAQIGLSAGYEMGVGTQVRYLDESGNEQSFGQSHQLMFGGLRVNVPLPWLTLGVLGHAGHHSFSLSPKSDGATPGELFPNVAYTFVEAGADLEVRVGHVFFGAHGAYLAVLDAGEIATDAWFPNASSYGVHYGASAGVAVSRFFDVLAGVDARLMAFNFNPISAEVDPATTPVAGGASDHYLSAYLALRFRLPGENGSRGKAAGAGEQEDGAEGEASGKSGGGPGDGGFDDFDSFD